MNQPIGNILIVDDNRDVLDSLEMFLKFQFALVKTCSNPDLIPDIIANTEFDVILLDMNFSAGLNTGSEGFFWLKRILSIDPDAVVVLFTAYGDVNLAVKAIKEGAADFVLKPWDNDRLSSTLNTAYRLRQSKVEVQTLRNKEQHLKADLDRNFKSIIGSSQAMQRVFDTVSKVAQTDANVLLLGENGTGKELFAREIHRQSNRAGEVFIGVDMGSLSESLFESEMFGHVKGAFTDAKDDRAGRFEIASGGTLFLDEIGNLPLSAQAKLLATIQNRTVIRVGSSRQIPIDIRLVCATNMDISSMVKQSKFREDLLYRINTIQIEIPPLRDRGDDIIELAQFFLDHFSKKYSKPKLRIHPSARTKLLKHSWPGNVRELEHSIEKAVILSRNDVLSPEDFFLDYQAEGDGFQFKELNLEVIEKEAIGKALRRHRGNLSETARALGVSRPTLYKKMEKYGL